MGTSLSYHTFGDVSPDCRRLIRDFLTSTSQSREWWAESIILFDNPAFPNQICGDTKLFCLLICKSAAERSEPLRSIDPDVAVCGLFVVGPMLGGAIIGGLGGAVGGMVLWRLIRWCCQKPMQS